MPKNKSAGKDTGNPNRLSREARGIRARQIIFVVIVVVIILSWILSLIVKL